MRYKMSALFLDPDYGILACTSASGASIPPMVIFANPELTTGEVPGTLYGLSESGWIYSWSGFTSTIYYVSFCKLLMHGHYSPDVIRAAAEQKILPPHTTHITQPLDRGCFSPLKTSWKEVCHDSPWSCSHQLQSFMEACHDPTE